MVLNKKLKKQTTDFLKCGLIGWGMECLWTGCGSLCGEKNKKMPCQTSIWMFPIYGMASVLSPLCKKMQGRHVLVRGSVYTACIFLTEYSTGSFLKKRGCCPWDYSKSKANYKGIVRFDYAPLWFLVGLMYEKVLMK
ncbi:MAG TPA: hypothetical protein DC035_09785 [Lachnospiraceae bacterium]|jgi:uncharacterized membrane protein|nr:hypothetical protein [Lachnospiraceae bacterium]